MEFIKGKCPKCNGELQIPENREKIICMYCGEEIEVRQAMEGVGVSKTVNPEKKAKYKEYAEKAIWDFPQMLFSIEEPLKDFKKDSYEKSFRAYEEVHMETMDAIEDAYLAVENPEQLLKELAGEFVTRVNEQMDLKKSRRQKDEVLMNYNMSIVVYVNPALIDHNKSSGEPLAEELLRQWKENFPKTNLKIAAFESINDGFKKRFCYITTAVCESLGKPDDCYELNLLRDYRDHYLQQTEEGEQLVKRYYNVAPTIVKHINQVAGKEKIYEDIFHTYLFPCIHLIENNEKEKCRIVYQNMVDTLEEKYFNLSQHN